MATDLKMLDLCLDYAKGGWAWGQRDCIGLMFELLRKTTGKYIKQSDYMPESMTYQQACDWLVNENEYVLFPYFKLFQDLKVPRAKPTDDGHIILLSKGPPLVTSVGDLYPIDPIPGIAFKPPGKLPMVFGGKGLLTTHIPEGLIDWVVRYELPGVV